MLGKASISAYARDALGYSGSQTRDLIALATRLDELDVFEARLVAGELE